jgi:hypothetical protein
VEDGRLDGVGLEEGSATEMAERGRAEALEGLYASVLGVLGVFLDASTWIRDGIDGLVQGGRRGKIARVCESWTGRQKGQRSKYSQSMTKLPSLGVAGGGTWCGEVWGSV